MPGSTRLTRRRLLQPRTSSSHTGGFQHATPQFIANRRGPTGSRSNFCGRFCPKGVDRRCGPDKLSRGSRFLARGGHELPRGGAMCDRFMAQTLTPQKSKKSKTGFRAISSRASPWYLSSFFFNIFGNFIFRIILSQIRDERSCGGARALVWASNTRPST